MSTPTSQTDRAMEPRARNQPREATPSSSSLPQTFHFIATVRPISLTSKTESWIGRRGDKSSNGVGTQPTDVTLRATSFELNPPPDVAVYPCCSIHIPGVGGRELAGKKGRQVTKWCWFMRPTSIDIQIKRALAGLAVVSGGLGFM